MKSSYCQTAPLETTLARPPKLTVFFDGACPLCSREIAYYCQRRGADTIAWVDVNSPTFDARSNGLSRNAALAQLYVQHDNGSLLSGVAAFRAIWAHLPGLRWLYQLTSPPGMERLLESAYRVFLKLRVGVTINHRFKLRPRRLPRE